MSRWSGGLAVALLAAALPASGEQGSVGRRADLISAARAIMHASPQRHWQKRWDAFYASRSDALLIEVVPEQLEIVDVARGIEGNPETWLPPTVRFEPLPPNSPSAEAR